MMLRFVQLLQVLGDIICISCFLFGLCIAYKGFKGVCCLRSDIKSPFKAGFLLQSIFQLTGSLAQLILVSSTQFPKLYPPTLLHVAYYLAPAIYAIQIWTLLIVTICRLLHTFNGSVYRVKHSTFIMIVCIAIVSFCAGIIALLFLMVFQFNDDAQISIITGTFSIFLYIIASIIVVKMFVNRLCVLTAAASAYEYEYNPYQYNQYNEYDEYEESDESDRGLILNELHNDHGKFGNAGQHNMITTATKYISLSSIGLTTTVVASIFTMSMYFIRSYYIMFQINGVLWVIDELCNVLCVFLQYSFSSKYYSKNCSCVHKKCQYLIITQIAKKRDKFSKTSIDFAIA
eukprot:UN02429